ncbi:guanylate cyclase domain-containing protein [Nephila pilipes]|uniref:Guanylate cyclase domain-containing protein n=1 Tax=Nephila pilipes TaxID=299642 RepID=A0A8X6TI80_NEPPI|nr:guanylate cyclase domain-containing protein [Nephila pilipes]
MLKRQFSTGRRKSSITEAEHTLQKLEDEEEHKERPDLKFLPLTFIPNIIVEEIMNESFRVIPYQIHNNGVILIADVCGFTSLTESYCKKGTSGIEELAKILNGYMSTLAGMLLDAGGDILNFAGDAFLVYWPESNESVEKAYDCAVSLQTHECLQTKNLDGTLKVKIGDRTNVHDEQRIDNISFIFDVLQITEVQFDQIGVSHLNNGTKSYRKVTRTTLLGKGKVVNWILGSPHDFLLFVIAGYGIAEAHHAEEMCQAGDIIVSKSVFKTLEEIKAKTFKTTVLTHGFVKISNCKAISIIEPHPERFDDFPEWTNEHVKVAKIFLIPSLRDQILSVCKTSLGELAQIADKIDEVSGDNLTIGNPELEESDLNVLLAEFSELKEIIRKMFVPSS